jgi:hypothetical protein
MLTTAVVFGKFGWWSFDDDDEYRGLLPLLIMSLIPWWGVRPKSLPRALLPPSLLALACGLLAFAFWRWERMPEWVQHIVLGLIQGLAMAALLLHIDWWHGPPQSSRGFVVLLVLNVLTSLFVGLSEMGDRPVFRSHGTQPNIFLAVLFVLVVPGILCCRVWAADRAGGSARATL